MSVQLLETLRVARLRICAAVWLRLAVGKVQYGAIFNIYVAGRVYPILTGTTLPRVRSRHRKRGI